MRKAGSVPVPYPVGEAAVLQREAMESKHDLTSDDAIVRYEAYGWLCQLAFRNWCEDAFNPEGAKSALRTAIITAIDAAMNPGTDSPSADIAGFKRFEYGIVRIVSGKHAGKIGFYDDDQKGWSSVYFGTPYVTRRFGVRPTEIGLASQKQKAEYQEKYLPAGWRGIAVDSFDRNQQQDRTRVCYQPRRKPSE